MSASLLKKALGAGLAAITLAGSVTIAMTNAAEARPGGRFGGGGRAFVGGGGGFGGGRAFVGGGGGYIQRVPTVGGRFYGGGSRFYGGGPRYYGGYGYRRGYGGGALAAGLVGGLALGALATAPYYGGYGYGYAPTAYDYGYGGCTVERRRVYDAFGRVIIQDVEVC